MKKNEMITFNRTYGGPYPDRGYSVSQTLDGGYIIVGSTDYDWNNNDVKLIKLDANGREEWSKSYDFNYEDSGYFVLPLADGNYIISGESNDIGNSSQYLWLMKIDGAGNEIWNKTIKMLEYIDRAYDHFVFITNSGFMVWKEGGDAYDIIITDLSGEVVSSPPDLYNSINQTSDNGFIIIDCPLGPGSKLGLFKTDSDFQIIWKKFYDKWIGFFWNSICQVTNGDYILVGINCSCHDGYVILMKTDVEGNKLWEKRVLLPIVYGDYLCRVDATNDGGFILYRDRYQILMKMDDTGNMIWKRNFTYDRNIRCVEVFQTRDGGYIVLCNIWDSQEGPYGRMFSKDITLLKLDSSGLLHDDDPHSKTERDWNYLLAIIGILVLITADIIVLATILKRKRKQE